jgi:hypothetical protein
MNENLTVTREQGDELCTPGNLEVDGAWECFTLEPRRDQSHGKPYLTPAGTYPWFKGPSERLDMEVIRILDVPGFTAIEMHPGNYPDNTDGCTLVGMSQAPDFVGHSDEAFAELMAKLPERGQITFQDAPTVGGHEGAAGQAEQDGYQAT